ncbi:MAG: class I SAM-dependent methyltransferase [Elusimicrobiota bacterium]
MDDRDLRERTIRDFGEQWSHYPDNDAYYASLDLLRDFCEPLLPLRDLKGSRVADIGSGTGRIVRMLIEAGASHVTAVEPSDSVEILRKNTADISSRVAIIHGPGEAVAAEKNLDFVISIGVLHHIPDPVPVLKAAYRALKPGGRLMIWVYGREGNRLYLAIFGSLRAITVRLPHSWLQAFCWSLNFAASAYGAACRVVPLPMHGYMRGVFLKLTPKRREQMIYDQLNPAYAKYYSREDVIELLTSAGFEEILLHHRHGYSWAAVARKPPQP